MPENTAILIKKLYKIFGECPENLITKVEQGKLNKQSLLEQHNHVLGINNISLTIPKGKLTVIMGLSGSGKSTLIRHINRLIEPTKGEIIIDGENILDYTKKQLLEFRCNKIAMVFQKFVLFPHLNVFDNVAYGLKLQNISHAKIKERVNFWLNKVNLIDYAKSKPRELSGGMQQRVGLARALVKDTDIVLMDEAFSALDPLIRDQMQDLLLDIQQELNKTIVFITHDLDEALKIGDQIAILQDGKLLQVGKPINIIIKPANQHVRDFNKNVNLLRNLDADHIMRKFQKPIAKNSKSLKKYKYIVDSEASLEECLATIKNDYTAKIAVAKKNELVGILDITKILKVL